MLTGEAADYLVQIGVTPLLTAREEIELARRIEAGVYAAHLVKEGVVRPGLEAVVADGRAARDHMIRANLRLVVSIAKRYAHRGLSLADVIQDGNLGLIQAVERFDHTRGTRFSTCATWWIRKAIHQGLEQVPAVRLPTGVRDRLAGIARAEATLTHRLGREPTWHEVAEETGQDERKISALRTLPRECVSLDTVVREGQPPSRLGDLMEDVRGPTPEQHVEGQALRDVLGSLMGGLAPRQALILRLRYGLDGHARHTRSQVAERVGLTGQWVRELEKESLDRLRHHGRRMGLCAWAG
ncbi:sigma-70 family RNA polymerase sigma factor [Nonomuraea sp. NPDC048916]|uniref:sigma-70 family RNA polymerase sigma factor n=1 Tax=Nonomuraea sp. NPDC048916 TaxID=3154232 RepID=UPI0033F6C5E1